MECSCSIECESDGYSQFHNDKMVTAKKEHKCTECRGIIKPGDKYEKATGKFDGEFYSYKTCPDCISLRGLFDRWCYLAIRESITEYVSEVYAQVPEKCIAALTPGARAFVCGVIEDYWQNDPEGDGEA